MGNSITPHIASREEIINYPEIKEGISEVMMVPVVSDYGPIDPIVVNNRELLNLFTDGNGIKRSDNISLKLAYILSQVSNIMVCRVANVECIPAVAVGATLTKCYVKGNVAYTTEKCDKELDTSSVAFVVAFNSPLVSDLCELEITKAYEVDKLGKLRLHVNSMDETYEFSMNLDAEDGYGESLHIERVNNLQNMFKILPFENIAVPVGKVKFGTVSGYSTIKMAETNSDGTISDSSSIYVINALNKMARYRRDLKIKFIYDAGLISNKIVETIESVARKRKSLGVFSCPATANTFDKIKSFYSGTITQLCNKLPNNSSYLYSCAPSKYSTEYLGWRELLPFSLFYILRVYSNVSGNMEFAPVFGKQTGTIDGSGMSVVLEHSTDAEDLALEDDNPNLPETEALQRLSCNPVVYDESLGTGYFVNNLTYQTPNLNQLSEENNRRLFNSIQFDLNKRLEDFLAKANNNITRDKVQEMIDNYKLTILDRLGYGIRGLRYDIVPYNSAKKNTLELTVEVCFLDSVKYIKVLYRNIPVLNS